MKIWVKQEAVNANCERRAEILGTRGQAPLVQETLRRKP